ncbi:MAG: glycosyltransferase [Actinomycetota bacterium]|nr:glycosyltransferase [Actinomycetota bacterium]
MNSIINEELRLERALLNAISAVEVLGSQRVQTPADEAMPAYGLDAAEDVDSYRAWLRFRTPSAEETTRRTLGFLRTRTDRPLISVLTPVFRPDPELLRRCVGSVRAQGYDRWEHCLCDDGSGDGEVTALLEELASEDERIRITARPVNAGISAATNSAAEVATGSFFALLDQDDELAPEVLGEVARTLLDDDTIDFLYTDEDKLDEAGERRDPFFKPDWSPDLLLSHMYTGHLMVIRAKLFREVGGFRSEFDGSQDYDLALRISERARTVAHVPEIGYHWRQTSGSTAQQYSAKPYADTAARAALRDAVARRGEEAFVEPGLHEGTFRVRRVIRGTPLVSIVIPFRDGAELLRRAVESLPISAGYDHWEALLVDNQSWEPETKALLPKLLVDDRCRVISYPDQFNWAAINNAAARQCEGDLLLFLNSDVEGRAEGWLAAMVEHAQRPEIGVVGARLLYPGGAVQHTGVVMGLGGGVAHHAFCFCPAERPGYFSQAKVIRNYSAVTGACMMVRRQVFEELGGFDERLAVAFNDIDFCLRSRQQGYRVVSTPFAELVHYESATRGRAAVEREESILMLERWADVMARDPYFNPNLDLRQLEFAVRVGPEEVDPWRALRLTLSL